MNIVVSILHYNNSQDTINCLKSLQKVDLHNNIKLITYVLDNGSKEEFVIDVEEYKDIGLICTRSDINTGFTGGHNLIYQKVKNMEFSYLLVLNNDCLLEKNSITQLLAPLKKGIGAVVPKIYFTKGHEFHKDNYKDEEKGKVFWYAGGYVDWDNVQSKHIGVDEVDKGQYDVQKEIDFATGACLMLDNEVVKKTGLFDEKYFLYFEDADLSQRILKAGYKLIYEPSSVVWHNNAGSSGSGSELHDYFLTRNRMLYGMRYAPMRTKVALLRESLRFLSSGRKWQKIGVKDYYLRKFGKGSFFANNG